MRSIRFRQIFALFFVTLALRANAAPGQCPENLCDCIGSLAGFVAVGGSGKISAGSYSDDGDRVVVGSSIDGSACFQSAVLRGRIDGDGDIGEDLILRNGPGSVAAKLRGYKELGSPTPGFSITGDIVTGGGSVRGVVGVDYDLFGNVILGGSDPRLASCRQAMLDMASVGKQLAETGPVSQTYGDLVVAEFTNLQAGPGVHVINISGNLRIEPGGFLGNLLLISTDIATDLVIINVAGDLIVGDDGTISSDFPDGVILNLTGVGRKVKIGKRATIDVPILAANSALLVQADSTISNIWTSKKMNLLGASVSDALVCDAPPEPAKVVFVLSDEYDGGTLAGLGNADSLCQQQAADASLAGTFKAWLSDSSTTAADRMSHAVVAYALPDGTVVANDWADLVDGTLTHAIDQDADGFSLDPLFDNLQVWTATEANGSATPIDNCADWTSADDFDDGAIGDASATDANWTAFDATTCDDLARLYCIQQ